MISKGWLRSQGAETLQGLGLVDDRSFDWRGFHDLGESSGDEVGDGVVDMVGGMVGEYSQGEMGGMQGQPQVGPTQQHPGQHVGHLAHVSHVGYGQPQQHMG